MTPESLLAWCMKYVLLLICEIYTEYRLYLFLKWGCNQNEVVWFSVSKSVHLRLMDFFPIIKKLVCQCIDRFGTSNGFAFLFYWYLITLLICWSTWKFEASSSFSWLYSTWNLCNHWFCFVRKPLFPNAKVKVIFFNLFYPECYF